MSQMKDYKVVGTATDGTEIREMANASAETQQAIDKVLATAPPGKSTAIVLALDLKGEVKAGIFGKKHVKAPGFLGVLGIRETVWTYGGTLAYDYKQKSVSGQAQVGIWF
jgi:hypothetical protein